MIGRLGVGGSFVENFHFSQPPPHCLLSWSGGYHAGNESAEQGAQAAEAKHPRDAVVSKIGGAFVSGALDRGCSVHSAEYGAGDDGDLKGGRR